MHKCSIFSADLLFRKLWHVFDYATNSNSKSWMSCLTEEDMIPHVPESKRVLDQCLCVYVYLDPECQKTRVHNRVDVGLSKSCIAI